MAVVIRANHKKLSFKWLRFPLTGIEALDHEHQVLLASLNVLKDLLAEGCDPRIVEERLRNLGSWFDRHFRDEEQRMGLSAYPEAEAHVEAHRQFLVGGLLQTTLDAEGQEGFDIDALFTWEAQHINQFDRPMAEFIHAQDGNGRGTYRNG
ncbi:MAG: hemerythrin domain-containing protein [Magnetococcales bacterium]|nr:hemerythrin domain-containing protein [Magnetococcales bacterium]